MDRNWLVDFDNIENPKVAFVRNFFDNKSEKNFLLPRLPQYRPCSIQYLW